MKRLAIYPRLPDELVTEILSHLPVRSLFRLKTVCKSWNYIISSSSFAKLHLDNYFANSDDGDDTCIFLRTFDSTIRNLKLSMVLPDRDRPCQEFALDADFGDLGADFTEEMRCSKLSISSKIVGPVNGLICIYGMALRERIALCNPCLKKTETLSRSPTPSFNAYIFRHVGLGLDSVNKDVKVVQLLSYLTSKEGKFVRGILVDIYSRKTHTWRKLERGVPPNTWAGTQISACNNGSFSHWLASNHSQDRDSGGGGSSSLFVLSFDMRKEVFISTQLPPCFSEYRDVNIKVFGKDNALFLFGCPIGQRFLQGDKCLERWVLNGLGDDERWTKLSPVGPLLQVSKPVALWKRHGLVLKYVEEKKKLVIYDYQTQEIRNIEVPEMIQCYPKVLEYKGSLIPLGV